MIKEEEAEAECQKKFCALPAPSHVIQPLYQEMMEMKEKESKQGREQRKNFLLSTQKPFSFQEREREKREKLIAMLNEVSKDQKNKTATVKNAEQELSETDLNGELICLFVYLHFVFLNHYKPIDSMSYCIHAYSLHNGTTTASNSSVWIPV